MPDLSIEYFYACSDTEASRYNVGGYTQEFAPWLPYPTCTCPAFKFAKKSNEQWLKCKHLVEADAHRCSWHQMFDAGEPVDGKCPKCGKEVIVVKCAV